VVYISVAVQRTVLMSKRQIAVMEKRKKEKEVAKMFVVHTPHRTSSSKNPERSRDDAIPIN
jgi:hypothetical protein